MIARSLVASMILTGHLVAGEASSQVLLCPEAPSSDIAVADIPAAAERLLKRLTIALDLHGHRGISEGDIIAVHADTPTALLGKLTGVAERCMAVRGDLEGFHDALPGLRKAFLEATSVTGVAGRADAAAHDPEIRKAVQKWTEAERVEESINLSVREIWRKLWFRSVDKDSADANRWAVIVASPPDADSGWDKLGEHQRRWVDAYFQLHVPYYDSNPHHAIVVGRRLPEDQARRLRDYAVELGMAEDAYIWPLPEDDLDDHGGQRVVAEPTRTEEDGQDGRLRSRLDLSPLKD